MWLSMAESNLQEKPIDPAVDGVKTASDDPADFLAPTFYMDFDNPIVAEFARSRTEGAGTDVEKAVRLFYAVRDEIRYDPYAFALDRRAFKASSTLSEMVGWCVEKGAVMAACCRAVGIPARLGYADVRNHLTTKTLADLMGTNLFTYHGYVELWLNGHWIKVTPVFDIALCEKFGVKTQEFDGTGDSLFQEYNKAGQRHMEYEHDHGPYTDIPVQEIIDDFDSRYEKWMAGQRAGIRPGGKKPSFADQAVAEGRPDD